MNTKMKRFLSVVLTVVMVIALLPANAMSVFAVAPEEVTVSAKLTRKTVENSYVNTLAVGETADLIVAVDGMVLTDLSEVTVTSSNSDVLNIVNGQLVGVHSGEAQVTATYNGVTSEPFAVTVVKESVYNFATSVFNIGNDGHFLDTNSYNGVINSYLSRWNLYNTWTDTSASKFIPFYVTSNTSDAEYVGDDGVITATPTGTNNGYVYLRMREDAWKLYPIWTDGRTNGNTLMTENEKYLNTYDYQNPWHTDSWQFTSLNYGINGAATYLKQFDKLYITTTLGFDDASASARYTPYIIFKLKVPTAGAYNVAVDAGSTSATGAYYTVYAASSATAAGDIMIDANKLGRLDTTVVSSGVMEEKFVAAEAGEYYFAFYFGVDGVNGPGNANKKFSTTLKSITLTLDEAQTPVLNGPTELSTTGAAGTYSVTQMMDSIDAPQTITNVTYSVISGGDKVTLTDNSDGTATVYGLSAGTATLQATFTGIDGKQYTKTVDITVTGRSILNYYFNLTSFDYTGAHLRLFNGHAITADAVTYLQDANYTHHNGNGGKWRLAEGTGDHIGSWISSAYIYNNATDSVIMEAYTNNRFTEISDRPFISFKVYIPDAGSYSVEVVTGRTSTVNYHFYMFNPADVSGLSYAVLCDKANEIGTLDSTKYSSAAMSKYITVDEPGEYYFVMSADNDLNTVDFTAEKVTMQLKSLTLKPVELEESELSKAEVTGKSAALGDGITMTLPYKVSGSSVKHINVYVAGKLYQTLPAGASGEINVDIYPRQLTDLIELYAADVNGESLTNEPFYSITLYAYLTQLIDAPAYASYHNLARSLITYCVEAQTYFGYGEVPADFADYAMSALQTPEAHSGRKPVGGTAVDGIKAKSATLILQDNLGIRFYFAVESGYDMANYVFTYGDTELTPVKEGSRYYVEVHDIMPYTYDEDVVIAVNDSLTVTYSPMDYIQKKYATGDADLQSVVKALYTYYKEAYAFKTANGQ